MRYSMSTSLTERLQRRDAVIMELIKSVRRFITLVRGLLMDRTARCKGRSKGMDLISLPAGVRWKRRSRREEFGR